MTQFKTIVVNKHKHPYDTYIGRGSPFGNPFVIGKHGTREYVILKYKLWLNTRPDLILSIRDFKGQRLGCFCKPEACHGDILVEIADSKNIKNWFSNMLPMTPIVYQGVTYNTSENFYQAMKLPKDRIDFRQEIANMKPYMAKVAIRDDRYPKRETWNKEESLKVMEFILRHKFAFPPYKEMLEMTEDWEIVEWNNWGDVFFGKDINTREGENHLGKILMKIRGNGKC